MFKVGDYVRAIRTSSCGGFVKGRVYLVTHVHFYSLDVSMDSKGNLNGWNKLYFTLADGPETSLEKEINDLFTMGYRS